MVLKVEGMAFRGTELIDIDKVYRSAAFEGEQTERNRTDYRRCLKSTCGRRAFLVCDSRVGMQNWGTEGRRRSVSRGGIERSRQDLANRGLRRGATRANVRRISKMSKIYMRKAGVPGLRFGGGYATVGCRKSKAQRFEGLN